MSGETAVSFEPSKAANSTAASDETGMHKDKDVEIVMTEVFVKDEPDETDETYGPNELYEEGVAPELSCGPTNFDRSFSSVVCKSEIDLGTSDVANQFGTHFLEGGGDTVGFIKEEPISEEGSYNSKIEADDDSDDAKDAVADGESPTCTGGKRLCKYCNNSYETSSSLRNHVIRKHSSDSQYRCDICNILAQPSLGHLEHHVATLHRDEKRWQCSKCGKSYKMRSNLANHMRNQCVTFHPYACDKCGYTCMTLSLLERHKNVHSKAKQLIACPICGKLVKVYFMKQHNLIHYGKKFMCKLCDFSTVFPYMMKRHYKKTKHDRPYHCQSCKFSCFKEDALKRHQLACTKDIGDYICSFTGCNEAFRHKVVLLNHSKMHNAPPEKIRHCIQPDCDFKCICESTLKSHYAKTKHHMPFKCPDCTLSFFTESSLGSHIQKQHVPTIVKKQIETVEYPDFFAEENYYKVENEPMEEDIVANFGKSWLGISGFAEEECVIPEEDGPSANLIGGRATN